MKKIIFLIDGHNFLYRLFYAVPPFTSDEGIPVNVVFGLARIIFEWQQKYSPNQVIFIFDAAKTNFRHEIYPAYKGTRDRMPDALRVQEGIILDLLEKMSIPVVRKEGYEADDVIGTMARLFLWDKEKNIFILSADKDLTQLIGDNIAVYDPMKHKIIKQEEVTEKFGVGAEFIIDYLALCGDTSDNIPGVPGLWPKKVSLLINTYGWLEAIYENLEAIGGKIQQLLEQYKDQAFLSKKLATIYQFVPIDDVLTLDTPDFATQNFHTTEVCDIFRKYNFKTLLPKCEQVEVSFDDIEIISCKEEKDLQALFRDINQQKKVSLSIDEVYQNIYFSFGKIVYQVEYGLFFEQKGLDFLLSFSGEIIGFELKDDIKKLLLFKQEQYMNTKNQEQISLF